MPTGDNDQPRLICSIDWWSITLYYMTSNTAARNQRRTLVYSVRLSPSESNAIQKIAESSEPE